MDDGMDYDVQTEVTFRLDFEPCTGTGAKASGGSLKLLQKERKQAGTVTIRQYFPISGKCIIRIGKNKGKDRVALPATK